MSILNFTLALLMGAVTAIYLPMISASSRIMGAPTMGNVPFFFIAFVASLIIAGSAGNLTTGLGHLTDVPKWMFLAGILSALIILGVSFLVPRIGPGAFFVLMVTGQIVMGAAMGHFGWLGTPLQPLSLVRATGVLVVVAGAILVTFGDQISGAAK